MCTIVKADCFIGIVLLDMEWITYANLQNIKKYVQRKQTDLIISISGDELQRAKFYYPRHYAFTEEHIAKVRPYTKEFLFREFVIDVPEEVINRIVQTVSEYWKQFD